MNTNISVDMDLIRAAISGTVTPDQVQQIKEILDAEHWPTPATNRPFGDALRTAWSKKGKE